MKKTLLLCFLLLSCTVGPEYKKPNFYSDEQIMRALEVKPKINNNYSYASFKDNTLNELIKISFASSPSIKQALSRVKQARLLLRITDVKGLPTFDIQGSYEYAKESKNIGYVLNEDIYQVGLDAVWEVDIFGSSRKNAEAQAANVMQTIENLNNVYVSLSSEIALNYIGYRLSQEQEKILIEQEKVNREILKENERLLHSGLEALDNVEKANIAVKNIQTNLLEMKNNTLQYKLKLALLSGYLPDGLNKILTVKDNNIIVRAVTIKMNTFFELPANVIQNRPDVKAAEYALKAQNAKVGVAMADMFPKVSLSAMLGFQALHIGKLFHSNSRAYSYQPGFSVPIFYFGQLKNNVEVQKEGYNEYLASYENTFLNAATEIKNALNNVQKAFKKYDLIQVEYQKTYKLYQLAKERFDAGLIDRLTLLNAQNDFLNSKLQLASANAAIYQSIIAFFKSIGTIS